MLLQFPRSLVALVALTSLLQQGHAFVATTGGKHCLGRLPQDAICTLKPAIVSRLTTTPTSSSSALFDHFGSYRGVRYDNPDGDLLQDKPSRITERMDASFRANAHTRDWDYYHQDQFDSDYTMITDRPFNPNPTPALLKGVQNVMDRIADEQDRKEEEEYNYYLFEEQARNRSPRSYYIPEINNRRRDMRRLGNYNNNNYYRYTPYNNNNRRLGGGRLYNHDYNYNNPNVSYRENTYYNNDMTNNNGDYRYMSPNMNRNRFYNNPNDQLIRDKDYMSSNNNGGTNNKIISDPFGASRPGMRFDNPDGDLLDGKPNRITARMDASIKAAAAANRPWNTRYQEPYNPGRRGRFNNYDQLRRRQQQRNNNYSYNNYNRNFSVSRNYSNRERYDRRRQSQYYGSAPNPIRQRIDYDGTNYSDGARNFNADYQRNRDNYYNTGPSRLYSPNQLRREPKNYYLGKNYYNRRRTNNNNYYTNNNINRNGRRPTRQELQQEAAWRRQHDPRQYNRRNW